ncbi:conserved hypothetical protein [Stenotrophomonas thermophila]|nr:conserved hypothetical protein [Stenotrophomonas maltophilia]
MPTLVGTDPADLASRSVSLVPLNYPRAMIRHQAQRDPTVIAAAPCACSSARIGKPAPHLRISLQIVACGDGLMTWPGQVPWPGLAS